jgi:heme-degrading monooxygenase HmoA
VIMRVWRTGVDQARAEEYERFAREESSPMFRAQRGFMGLLFGRSKGVAIVTTLWEDHAAADELENSARYRATVARITAAGFLAGESTVERFEVHGYHLPPAS